MIKKTPKQILKDYYRFIQIKIFNDNRLTKLMSRKKKIKCSIYSWIIDD